MEEKNKRNYSKELNKIAEEFNKPIVEALKNSIQNITKYYQLSINDLCKLCDIDETIMSALTDDSCDADCLYDLRTIALLVLLSNGKLNILNDTPSGKAFNEVNCIIKDYQDEKNPEPTKKPVDGWDNMVKQMLELFGVKNLSDMEHLLNAVKSVRNTIDSFEKYNKIDNRNCECDKNCKCKENKTTTNVQPKTSDNNKQVYVDANGNFHSQKPYTNEQTNDVDKADKDVVKGAYYDSETMEKPKEFEFTGNFDKILPNVVNLISNYINKLNL